MVMIGSPSSPVNNMYQAFQPSRPFQPSGLPGLKPSLPQDLFNSQVQGMQSKLPPALQSLEHLPTPASLLEAAPKTPFTTIPNSFSTSAFPNFNLSNAASSFPKPTAPAGSSLASATLGNSANIGSFATRPAPTSPLGLNARTPASFAQPYRPLGSSLGGASLATSSPGMPFSPTRPGVGNMAAPAASLAEPLSPAEETGQKVGEMVTTLLEENPALQEKIQNIDLDAMKEDIGPRVETLRSSVQQAIKPVPRWVDRKVIRLFDTPDAQRLATQFDEWLRKPPEVDPALAETATAANRPKPPARPGRESGLDSLSDPMADDPYADEMDPALEEGPAEETPPPKKSMLGNIKSKVWPFNKDNKENEEPVLERSSTRKRKASQISDADLDAMLNNSLGEPGRPVRRRRPLDPLDEEEMY